ncbi:MAG: M1 family metallopeptidase, partial [Bacteroidota bacterium]|nr:M1 family metallopeptidase [Bacteroidota bacterium]
MKSLHIFIFLLINLIYHSTISQEKYFQQKVDTYIDVELDDKKHFLYGFEKIVYTNNSNQNLDSILIHLWPNAYQNIDTELGKQKIEDGQLYIKYAPNYTRGYIDSLEFKVNSKAVKWKLSDKHIDIAILSLNNSLKKGDSIEITTPFRVKIPSGRFSRLGHIGQSYQITQWFPKPAVYDADGWHPLPYLNQGEFYSEFGKYDVSITLPDNYVIMATGDLQNTEEIKFLNKKAIETEKLIAENKLPITDTLGKKDMSFPKSNTHYKTVRFIQNDVHDFAWFADKRYHVLKGEVKLPSSGRTVETWALFTNNEAKLWSSAIEYLNDATYYFSKWVGEYPYNHVTAVDGTISAGGGMEYPNITVIGSSGNKYGLETVIIHEVGHNWYYGILGSNERDHAWMDEGLNTYIEIRYFEEKYGNQSILNLSLGESKLNLDIQHKDVHRIGYQFNASRNYDQPMQMGSPKFTSMNYGGIVYSKTGIGFHYLKDYLGEELFDNCMHTYFDKWKFKHPKPKDIAEVFSLKSNKNLSWFFDDYVNTT